MKMKRLAVMAFILMIAAGASSAKTVKEAYTVPCATLWPAVKDTVRNSGYYAMVFLDNEDMIVSFAVGAGANLRINSAVLNAKGDGCEMQAQPFYYGALFSEDAGDFKKRVDASLARLQSSPPAKQENSVK